MKDVKQIKVDILDQKGKVVGSEVLNNEVFGVDVNTYLIHAVATAQANNARQGTKSALTRAEVRGHSKKPYRQKGTGNARQGSTKGPQFDGGGVVFAPKPRDFTTKINKKQRAAAFVSAISGKLADKELIIINSLDIQSEKPCTKKIAAIVNALAKTKNINSPERKILFVKQANDVIFVQSAANIPNTTVTTAAQLSVHDIVNCKYIVASLSAVKAIEEQYVGGAK